MTRKTTYSTQGGFTLVEVLVAGSILAIGLSAILIGLGMSRRSAEMAQRQVVAMHAARSVAEQLQGLTFEDSLLSVGRHSVSNGYYDVAYVSGDVRTKQIDIRTSWRSVGRAHTNQFPLTTWMSATLHK